MIKILLIKVHWELDKDKDTFTWTAKDPTSLLGKTVHVDIDAKVKQGTDLSKYKLMKKIQMAI